MKLDKMYLEMQKRYETDVVKEQKAQEEERRKAEEKKRRLKALIENLIKDVLHELENNMQEEIYEGYKVSRKASSRCKNRHTKLKCFLDRKGFCLNVVVSGYHSKDIIHEFNFDAMNEFVDYMAKYFNVEEDDHQYILEYSLDENDVTFYWDIGKDIYGFKVTLKSIFSSDSVRRCNGVDFLKIKLD